MASRLRPCPFTITVPLLILLVLFQPSSCRVNLMITQVMRKQICSHSRDPNLCNQILADDPRTAAAGLYGITVAIANMAITSVTDTKSYIQSLPSQGNLAQLQYCLGSYDTALNNLHEYTGYLEKHSRARMHRATYNSLVAIDSCDRQVAGVWILTERNYRALELISMARAVLDIKT